MARTQSADFDRRKSRIVTTAARLFAGHGFRGTSIAELARACDSSKALVYHYFMSKEDILYDVMSSHLDDLLAAAEAEREISDPVCRLDARTRAFLRLYVNAADFQKVLLNELDNLPADRRTDIVSRQRRIVATIQQDIAAIRGSEANSLPVTMLYFGMINWTHTWFSTTGRISADELAAMVMRLCTSGIAGA